MTPLCVTVAAVGLSGCGKRTLEAPEQSRAVAQACSETAPGPGTCNAPSSTSSSDQFLCISDANCTAGVNGRCMSDIGPAGCYCQYDTCTSDASCGSDQVCACRDTLRWGNGNTCVTGNCRTNADCPSGYCSLSQSNAVGYFCHTDHDICRNDSDCSGVQNCAGSKQCEYTSDVGYWHCLCIPEPV